eukprot:scaffold56350_cov52-Prasinocladus_malaysianus.AAC.1
MDSVAVSNENMALSMVQILHYCCPRLRWNRQYGCDTCLSSAGVMIYMLPVCYTTTQIQGFEAAQTPLVLVLRTHASYRDPGRPAPAGYLSTADKLLGHPALNVNKPSEDGVRCPSGWPFLLSACPPHLSPGFFVVVDDLPWPSTF